MSQVWAQAVWHNELLLVLSLIITHVTLRGLNKRLNDKIVNLVKVTIFCSLDATFRWWSSCIAWYTALHHHKWWGLKLINLIKCYYYFRVQHQKETLDFRFFKYLFFWKNKGLNFTRLWFYGKQKLGCSQSYVNYFELFIMLPIHEIWSLLQKKT